jgi:pyridoxal phosphate enzyme (YggS family)
MNDVTSIDREQLAENVARVRANINRAAEKKGSNPADITLVAVSKTKPLELVQAAYTMGVRDFGENRVQEALSKSADFHPADLHWHLIGHLQSNKASKVVGPFACIHSVDSLHLAQILDHHAQQQGKSVSILLQVNIAGETSKEGMTPEETPELARQILALPGLRVEGLMTIAPLVADPEEVRPVFRSLRQLRDRLRDEAPGSTWSQLSMGMTDDYMVAIEEGATLVRVGRALFGARAAPQL